MRRRGFCVCQTHNLINALNYKYMSFTFTTKFIFIKIITSVITYNLQMSSLLTFKFALSADGWRRTLFHLPL
jgi:hypothetical protein